MPGNAIKWEEALRNAPDEYAIITYVRRYDVKSKQHGTLPREQIVQRSIFSLSKDQYKQLDECLYEEDLVVVPLKTA